MTAEQFKLIVLPHYKIMYRVAFSVTRSEDDASDIVQDTMVRLWQNNEQLKDVNNIGAYCVSATKRQCFTFLRTRKSFENFTDEVYSVLDSELDLERITEGKNNVDIINRIIDTLPYNQQQVIRLSSFVGCSNDEIANLTGLSNENIRTLLSRGRKRIKELFSKIK